MRIIGVDYGLKRTGVAIWDSQINLFLPMMVVEKKDLNDTAQSVADIAFFERADMIVVGYPLSLSGEMVGDQIKITSGFVAALKSRTTIPIEVEDERLTTDLAERLNLSAGGRRQAAATDALAAAAILESYVTRKRPQDRPQPPKSEGDAVPPGSQAGSFPTSGGQTDGGSGTDVDEDYQLFQK